jgi:hypothetical protein
MPAVKENESMVDRRINAVLGKQDETLKVLGSLGQNLNDRLTSMEDRFEGIEKLLKKLSEKK